MNTPRRRRPLKLAVELLETRDLPSAPVWAGFGHDAQHTARSAVVSQSLEAIHWSMPVDTNRQYTGNDLLIHYGSPMVTAANTVLVPVKTTDAAGNTVFQVEAHNGADGSLLWTQQTDYVLPSSSWTPSFQPTLTPGSRLYYQGIGGQVYYSDKIDQSGATRTGTVVFFGQSNYNQDPTAYNNNLKICTPITSDAAGNIYFGFQVLGSTPLNLSSGIARIDKAGNGTYVSASAAANDAGITCMQFNSAPAISKDGKTVYVAVNSGSGGYGYLLALDSTTLGTQHQIKLLDPSSGNTAKLTNQSTASPLVGPDGDVYFGVLENPFPANNDRGWLLHFSGDLQTTKTPGAFGWDDTASIVPTSMIPGYSGTSTYLLMTKYNNYAGINTGNGQNKIAILDPNATMTDPVSGATVMNEVRTILGPTPDADHPGGVREWCINTAVVDPATDSVLANSEDGKLYRWRLDSNTVTQSIVLTSGIGEAYTPTLIGVDGTVYAINDGTLFAVGLTKVISGQIYNDVNGNGSRDTGDNGLSGWTVFLDANNNGTLDAGEVSTTTDANGYYRFADPANGTYHVREVTKAGWVQTSANQGVTIDDTHHLITVNYGNFKRVSINGTVYNDQNDNHAQNSGEPGLANVTINLDGVAAATTDANGKYTISGVGPGTHTLSEVIPSAYVLLVPGNNVRKVTPQSGTNIVGNFVNALLSATSDNGQSSYSELGTSWTTLLQGWNGSSSTHASSGSAGNSATWTLGQSSTLPAGKYEIFVSYVPASDRDTKARYTVFDGSVSRGTALVNQTVAPADSIYQGVAWKSLGKFNITSGQASVRLDVRSIGSVDADGVLLIPAGAATSLTALFRVDAADVASIGRVLVETAGTGSAASPPPAPLVVVPVFVRADNRSAASTASLLSPRVVDAVVAAVGQNPRRSRTAQRGSLGMAARPDADALAALME
jgi:hypothetical protein